MVWRVCEPQAIKEKPTELPSHVSQDVIVNSCIITDQPPAATSNPQQPDALGNKHQAQRFKHFCQNNHRLFATTIPTTTQHQFSPHNKRPSFIKGTSHDTSSPPHTPLATMSVMNGVKNGFAMRRLIATHSRQEGARMACPTLRPPRKNSAGALGPVQAQPEDPRKIFLMGKKKLVAYVKKAGANSPHFLKERLLTSRLLYRIAKDILAKPRNAAATVAATTTTKKAAVAAVPLALVVASKPLAEEKPIAPVTSAAQSGNTRAVSANRPAMNMSSAESAPAFVKKRSQPTLVMCGQVPVIMSKPEACSTEEAPVTPAPASEPKPKRLSAFAMMSSELQKALPAARRSITKHLHLGSATNSSSQHKAKRMSPTQASWEQVARSRSGGRQVCQV